jgi:hypothetical protein
MPGRKSAKRKSDLISLADEEAVKEAVPGFGRHVARGTA